MIDAYRVGYVAGVVDAHFLRDRRFNHKWCKDVKTDLLTRMDLSFFAHPNQRWIFQHWLSDVIYEIDWRS